MSKTTKQSALLYTLHCIPGIGQEKLSRLLRHFENVESIWNACDEEFLSAKISSGDIAAIRAYQENLTATDQSPELLWKKYADQGIHITSILDKDYPQKLRENDNAPVILYYRGDIRIAHEKSVAIVGSRKFTTYGKQAAIRMSFDLATYGIHIISGLALGIDSIAHRATIEAIHETSKDGERNKETGKTIAVLGGGIDDTTIAPRTHYGLAHDIINTGGVLLSAFAPGTKPSKGTFPARNAVMVILSDATLIVEAQKKSGTLITAEIATEATKKLFAVPGSIFTPSGVGSNQLIASGAATLAQSAQDIANHIGVHHTKNKPKTYTPASPEQKKVYETLLKYPDGALIDKIVRETTLEGAVVSSTLVMMEIEGVATHLGGGQYAVR
jgi:DNA processing protein